MPQTVSLTHLKTGFFEWLMGAIPAGIVFPENWDLKGIFHFVSQMFSLTWDAIKTKVVKKVGQPVMDARCSGCSHGSAWDNPEQLIIRSV